MGTKATGLLPEGFEPKPFKPIASVHDEMDMLDVLVKDASTVSIWHGQIHLETLCSFDKKTVLGFHLVCYQALQKPGVTKLTLVLLWRAFRRDFKNLDASGMSKEKLISVYSKVLLLLLYHPRLWVVKD